MKKIRLSPSALSVFKDCPKCFWLEKVKYAKRPRGIFPSLPGGIDTVLKKYFDEYRKKNEMPPELQGRIDGKLFNILPLLEKWRSWRVTDLYYEDKKNNVMLSGALDDCLVHEGLFIPLDYKTKGYPVTEDPAKYYQTQLDCYCLMLHAKGHKIAPYAYLLYYWPEQVKNNGMIKFAVEPFKVYTNIESAKDLVTKAAKLLQGPIPESSPTCEYCTYLANRHAIYKSMKNTAEKTVEKPLSKEEELKKEDNMLEYEEENGQYHFF